MTRGGSSGSVSSSEVAPKARNHAFQVPCGFLAFAGRAATVNRERGLKLNVMCTVCFGLILYQSIDEGIGSVVRQLYFKLLFVVAVVVVAAAAVPFFSFVFIAIPITFGYR